MKKITIGLFIDTFYPFVDGVVKVVDNYARKLNNKANVIVFAPKYQNNEYDDSKLPYKVVRCISLKVPFIDYSLSIPDIDEKFKKEIDKYNLDIVHIHSPFTIGKIGIKYAKKHHIPVIGTMHSQFKQDFYRATKNEFISSKLTKNIIIKEFNKCDECFAVNEEIAKLYYNEYGYKCLPKVINNATDMKPIKDNSYIEIINKKYNLNNNTKVLLFVGRINKLKNIFFIVDALKIVKNKSDINFKMFFVGTGQDENLLKKYIKDNNLENEIILVGKITDIFKLESFYKRADLFLFPSLYDASSIVQIEASSQSTPTLFIEGAKTSSGIIDSKTGFISKNNKNEYANYIIKILNDEDLLKKVSINAYKNLYINWDKQIDIVYKNYLRIIKEYNKNN